ncbi:MAG: DUF1003 domain-containing protein [Bradyrhizobium sp.]|jgi:uncharacterized membrane protein
MAKSRNSSSVTAENIEAVIRLEEEEEHRSTPLERISHVIGTFVGTIYFVALQCALIVIWVAVNKSLSFDPFPYPLLSLFLCGEAVILSSFVLIRQNRTELINNRRNHLDLQINLLAEKEVTKVLQLLTAVNEHLKVPGHASREDEELTEETAVEELAQQLKEKEVEGAAHEAR